MSSKRAKGCRHGTGNVELLQLPTKPNDKPFTLNARMLSSLLDHYGVEIADLGERDPDWFQYASKKATKYEMAKMSPCSSKICFKTPTNPSLSATFTQDGPFAPPADFESSTVAHDRSYTGLLQSESSDDLGKLWSPINFSPKVLNIPVAMSHIPVAMSTPHRMSASLGAKLDDSDMVWSSSLATPMANDSIVTSCTACDPSTIYSEKTTMVPQNIPSRYKSSVRTALTYSPLLQKANVAANEDPALSEHQTFRSVSTRKDEDKPQERCHVKTILSPAHSSLLSQDCVDLFDATEQEEQSDEDALDISNKLDLTKGQPVVDGSDWIKEVNDSTSQNSASQSKLRQLGKLQDEGSLNASGANVESNLTTSLEFLFMTPPVHSYSQQCRRKRSSSKSKRVDSEDDLLSVLIHAHGNISFDNVSSYIPTVVPAVEIESDLAIETKSSPINKALTCNAVQSECIPTNGHTETDNATHRNSSKCFEDDEEMVSSSCIPFTKCNPMFGPTFSTPKLEGNKFRIGPKFSTPKLEGNKFRFGPSHICTQMTNENVALSQEFFATVPLSALHNACHASSGPELEISVVVDPAKLGSPRINQRCSSNEICVAEETHCNINKGLLAKQVKNSGASKMDLASITINSAGSKDGKEAKGAMLNQNTVSLPLIAKQQVSSRSNCKTNFTANTCRSFVYPTAQQIIKEYPEQVLHLRAMSYDMVEPAMLTCDAEAVSVWDNENSHTLVEVLESASKSVNFKALSGHGQFLSLNSYHALLPTEENEHLNQLETKETKCNASNVISLPSSTVEAIPENANENQSLGNNEQQSRSSKSAALQVNEATKPAITCGNKEQPILNKLPVLRNTSLEQIPKTDLGFKFASGKIVCVSHEALETAQELWDSTVTMNSSFSSSGADVCDMNQQSSKLCSHDGAKDTDHANVRAAQCLAHEASLSEPISSSNKKCDKNSSVNCKHLNEKNLPESNFENLQLKVNMKNFDDSFGVPSRVSVASVEGKKSNPCSRLNTSSKTKNADDTDDDFLPFGEVSMTEVLEVAESTYACLQAMELDEVVVNTSKVECIPPLNGTDAVKKTAGKESNEIKKEQQVVSKFAKQLKLSIVEPEIPHSFRQTANCNDPLQIINTDEHVDQDVSAVLENIVALCCVKEAEQYELAYAGFNKEELFSMCLNLSGFCSSQWKPEKSAFTEDKNLEQKMGITPTECLSKLNTYSNILNHFISNADKSPLGHIHLEDDGLDTFPSSDSAMCANICSKTGKGETSSFDYTVQSDNVYSQNDQCVNTVAETRDYSKCRNDILKFCPTSEVSAAESSFKKRLRKISDEDNTKVDKYASSCVAEDGSQTKDDGVEPETKRARLEKNESITVDIENVEMTVLSAKNLLCELCETVATKLDKLENSLFTTAALSHSKEPTTKDAKQLHLQELPLQYQELTDNCAKHIGTMAEKVATGDKLLVQHEISVVPEVYFPFDDSFTSVAEAIQLSVDTMKSLDNVNFVSNLNMKSEEMDLQSTHQFSADNTSQPQPQPQPLKCYVRQSDEYVNTENEQVYAYGGHSTASSNTVPISHHNPLGYTKQLFCDDYGYISISEKQMCLNNPRSTVKTNEIQISSDVLPNDELDDKHTSCGSVAAMKNTRNHFNKNCIVDQISKSSFGGFCTAGGKTIQVSDNALMNAKKMFDESVEKTSLSIKPKCLYNGSRVVVGGREVKVSIAALKNGKSLEETTVVVEKTEPAFGELPSAMQMRTNTVISTKKLCADRDENICVNNISNNMFGGFATASGKYVQNSEDALQKAKILAECDEKDAIHNQTNADEGKLGENSDKFTGNNFEKPLNKSCESISEVRKHKSMYGGFCTAGGKTILVSEDALKNAKKLLNDADQMTAFQQKSDAVVGFCPAGRKKVSISEDALNNTKKSVGEMCDAISMTQEQECALGRIPIVGNKIIPISGKALQHIEHLETSERGEEMRKDQPVVFCGFSTAGGKLVQISNDALENAKKLFNGINDDVGRKQLEIAFCNAPSTNGKMPNILEEELNQTEVIVQENVKNPEAALNNIKKGFVISEQESTLGRIPLGNKIIPISSKTLQYKEQSESSEKSEDKKKEKPMFCGFSTAGGKLVQISNDALENAKKLFNGINGDIDRMQQAIGFCNPSSTDGKMLHISKEELKQTDEIYQEIIQNPNTKPNKNSTFGGFSTASGKNIHISDNALKEAKQLLDESKEHGLRDQGRKNIVHPTDCSNRMLQPSEKSLTTQIISSKSKKAVDSQEHVTCDPTSETSKCTNHAYTECQEGCNAKTRLHRSFVPGMTDSEIDESMAAFLADEADCRDMSSVMKVLDGETEKVIVADKNQCSESCNPTMSLNQLITISISDCMADSSNTFNQSRIAARKNQEAIIKLKRSSLVKPVDGKYWVIKSNSMSEKRVSMKEAVGGRFPEAYNKDELIFFGAHESVLRVNSSCSEEFKFSALEFSDCNGESSEVAAGELVLIPDDANSFGKNEFYSALLASPGVDPNLVDAAWMYNHYRWIVWKLAAMEVAFPQQFAGQCLVPEQVAAQLKYRYNKEIDHSQRSALKRILERDDSAVKTMVLCVAKVIRAEKSSSDGEGGRQQLELETTLEVTDGWYGMRAVLDEPLKHLVINKKITVGQKLIVHGAELVGSNEACNPLEIPSNLFLKLAANSTRRAHWSVKLGFYKHPQPFPISLSSVLGNGGGIGCVLAVVARVYSMQYMEKSQDTFVFRNDKAEAKAAAHYEECCRTLKEKLFNSVVEQFEKEESKRAKKLKAMKPDLKIENLQTGEEVHRFLDLCDDPSGFMHLLTASQQSSFSEYSSKLVEKQQICLQNEFQKQLLKEQEEGNFPHDRVVIPFVRILLAGVSVQDEKQNNVCTLTVWKPTSDYDRILKEGCPFRICYLMASNYNRNNAGFQLATTRRTTYESIVVEPSILQSVYFPREVCSFEDLQKPDFHAPYSEVDVVGLVVSVSNSGVTVGFCQMVYLADEHMDLIAIKAWIDKCGLDEALQVGNLIAACNLQIRQREVNGYIPLLHSSEMSTFTQHPRKEYLRVPLDNLKTVLKNDSSFANVAASKLSNLLCTKSNMSTSLPQPSLKTETDLCITALNSSNSECSSALLNCEVNSLTRLKSGIQKESLYGRYPNELLAWTDKLCTGNEVASNTVMPLTPQNPRTQSKFFWLQRVGVPPPLSPLALPLPNTLRKSFKSPFRTGSKAYPQSHLALPKAGDSKTSDDNLPDASGLNLEDIVRQRDSPTPESPPMDLI